MIGYLLDTDIVVFLFRNKKGIAKRLSSLEPALLIWIGNNFMPLPPSKQYSDFVRPVRLELTYTP